MSKDMVIIQVLPALNSGGVERGAIDVANFLTKSGHKSIIISTGGKSEVFLKSDTIHIKMNVKSKNPITIFKNIKKIRNIIKEYKADILHVRSRAPAWSCFYAIRGTKCKLLNTFHGTHSLNLIGKKESILKKKYNEIMLKGKKVIAVSNFIKDHIKENYPKSFNDKKIEVIHRGVDVEIFDSENIPKQIKVDLINKWQVPDDKKIIMLPGRITFWKGHEFLLDSLKLLNRDDYLCLFVGEFIDKNNYKKRLEKKISDNDLQSKIKFVGSTTSMAAAYSICDVVISASVNPEAFGRVAIEAQSMTKVIIATNIGGSKETVIDGKTGFLVEPNNHKEMADKIDDILSMDEDKRHKIGVAARKNVVQKFSNNLMYKKILKVYKELSK